MRNRCLPYHKIVAARLARSKERRGALQANRYTEIDRFMLTYEQAYHAYYGLPITIEYRHGWYYINHHRHRHSAVDRMTNILLAHIQDAMYPQPEEGDTTCATQL